MPVADDGYSVWFAGDFIPPEPEPFDEYDDWVDEYGHDVTDKRRAGEAYVGNTAIYLDDDGLPLSFEQTQRRKTGEVQ